MCGIAGMLYADTGRMCSTDRLRAMADIMSYRGPDDAGTYVDDNLGFAHRRLSIIDLGSGHQPMETADEALCIVFNGEIYNYRQLRQELIQRGHIFRTQSDTEVLLHLYREYGDNCPEKLNGIFAFAIWDRSRRRLFLARDHMGIKPLYYTKTTKAFVFASEIKSLFQSEQLSPQVELEALREYFVFGYIAGGHTLFRDVQCLLPGHYMTVERGGQVNTRRYWNALSSRGAKIRNEGEALEGLAALVESAVHMQMISDVPLGTFCSGGVDSSLVSAVCAKKSSVPINTYSIGFQEADYDETMYAQMVSRRYGTQHHELRVDQQEFAELLPRLIWHNDEPLNFANSVQIFALSRLAKQKVTVVLTGEGADELFGGYPRYLIPTVAARMQWLPPSARRLLGTVARLSPERRLRKLAAALAVPLADAVLFNAARYAPAQALRIWDAWSRPSYRIELYGKFGLAYSALQRVSLIDQHTYLVSILSRQDKMSMAASVESRVPFLDYRIVEFANSLPDRFKQVGSRTKIIWKRLAERYLPHEVVHRRKSGFGVPLKEWLNGSSGLGELAQCSLTAGNLPELDGILPIETLLTEHRDGHADHGDALWTALNYVLWKQAFGVA